MISDHDFRTEAKNHGSRQLEIKSHFPLGNFRKNRYILDSWIFIPSTLGINNRNYDADRFFAELKSLTRFSASHIPLASIIDTDCDVSPLVRIRNEFDGAAMPRDVRPDIVLYELRSLANIYSSESNDMEKLLADEVADGKLVLIKSRVKTNLKEVREFLDQWRGMYSYFRTPTLPAQLHEAYDWTDESIAITTERFLHHIHESIGIDEESASLLKKIRTLNEKLTEHREAMGYRELKPESSPRDVEERIYRESILKKWGQSVLYLSHQESSTRRNMNQILAGIAAAVAMAFAIVTTLLAERYFPGRSLPWAIALIGAYIFKDRIKETLRNILVHTLPSLVSDQRIRLTDQTSGHRIGRVSSRVRFMKAGSAPKAVEVKAEKESTPFGHILPEEDLVHFRREFSIRTGILKRYHARLENLTDIVRLNLQSILANMDAPGKDIPVFVDGSPSEVHGHRTYPLDLVLSLSDSNGRNSRLFHYRIILDRKGIRRIEPE